MALPNQTVLVADGDVIVRIALSDYLRACGFTVFEAADGAEAKAILRSGLAVTTLLSDAQLAGAVNGFALAQWVRRYRPTVGVLLTTTIASKAQTAASLCTRFPGKPPSDAAGLAARIRAMQARKRRARPPAAVAPRRRRRT